jgi:type I restriction enzyme R subunit
MTTLKINQGYTVQFPMVKHVAEIGWTVMAPDEAEAKRQGKANSLFRDELEAKLRAFNSWLTESQARAIVDTIEALPPTIEGNRDVLSWIRGERQWYDEAEKRHRPVHLIDFDAPSTTPLS